MNKILFLILFLFICFSECYSFESPSCFFSIKQNNFKSFISKNLINSDTAKVKITIEKHPCLNQNDGVLNTEVSGLISPLVYSWNILNETNQNLNNISSGKYFVTVNDANGNYVSDTIVLSALDLPPVDLLVSDTLVCQGKELFLYPYGATSYTWKDSDSIVSNEDGSYKVILNQNKTISVKGIGVNNCSSYDSVSLSVYQSPRKINYKVVEDKISMWPAQVYITGVEGGTPPYRFGGFTPLEYPFNLSTNVYDRKGMSFLPFPLGVIDSNNCFFRAPDIKISDSVVSNTTIVPPNFNWVKSIGSNAEGFAVKTDSKGNSIVVGSFKGMLNLNSENNFFELNSNENATFVIKYDSLGNLLWAKNIGTNQIMNCCFLVSIDSKDNIIITLPKVIIYRFGLPNQIIPPFIYKFSQDGELIFVKEHDLDIFNLSVDVFDNIYITGFFSTTNDFDFSESIYEMIPNTNYDGFITKMDSMGNFIWAKNIGFCNDPILVEFDFEGNCYIAGDFPSGKTIDFDPSENSYELTSDRDQFYILKLSNWGNLEWMKLFDNKYGGLINIKLDSDGNLFFAGNMYDTVDLDPGIGTFHFSATDVCRTPVVVKLTNNGEFLWAKQIARGCCNVKKMIIDKNDNLFFTGIIDGGADFEPSLKTYYVNAVTEQPLINTYVAFISKMNKEGEFDWVYSVKGPGEEKINNIHKDDFGNVFATGVYDYTANFGTDTNPQILNSNGDRDAFILKIKDVNNSNKCNNIKAITNLSGNVNFCNGVDSLITANKIQDVTYSWFKNGNLIKSSFDTSIVIKESGNYKLKVSNNQICNDSTDNINVNIIDVLKPNINIDKSNYCTNNLIKLISNYNPEYSYKWFKNDSVLKDVDSNIILIGSAGKYYLRNEKFNCYSISEPCNLFFKDTITWNGQVDSDWHKPCNWSPEVVPEICQVVEIPTTPISPIVSGIANAKNINLYTSSGATLKINNDAILQIESTLLTKTENGCPLLPKISTSPIISLTSNTAILGGGVSYEGNSAVIVKGICWSTSPNPTVSNSKTLNGSGKGTFQSELNGLIPNTVYYARSYAANLNGTNYGEEVVFKTKATDD